MSETRIIDPRIEAYIEQVARALEGVEPEERAALLDDVREHAEATVADEPGIDLAQRLGAPAVFARELLDAAGVTAAAGRRRRSGREILEAARTSRAGLIAQRAGRDFAPLWAALRGAAVVWIVARLLESQVGSLLPWLLLGGGAAGWLLADRFRALARSGRPGRALCIVLDVATLLVGVVLLWAWASSFGPDNDEQVAYIPPAGLNLNGALVMGIQAFGPDGAPSPVALIDQDGTPITVEGTGSEGLYCTQEDQYPVAVPYLSTSGQPIPNAYPARGVCIDGGNVVQGPAIPAVNAAAVQTWASAPLPAPGQTILVDDTGQYMGIAAGSPSASPSAPADDVVPSPSASAG